ncbi:hypothetical protein ACIBI0_38665 [Microbispora rosea]|uniref:hypothetical protein n=1 Tax=Microbispora rosea TaxID=58117 RepID=UPI00379176FE
MTTKFQKGQRVRSTVELTSLEGSPPEDAIPAGSAGTVVHIHRNGGYGVRFDHDQYRMSAWVDLNEIEAI